MRPEIIGALLLLAPLTAGVAAAQSLEEAAAREAARRRQAGSGRTYTDRDLPKAPAAVRSPGGSDAKSEAAEPARPPSPESAASTPRSEGGKPVKAQPEGPPPKTEAEWRQSAEAARRALEAAGSRLKVAESKKAGADEALATATALAHKGRPEALFVVLEEAKDAAKEAEEAQAALTAAEAALENLAAEAKEAGIPDSWWADPKSS